MKHVQTDFAQTTRAAVVPTVRYRDLGAAIEWLCTAFGFERHRIVKDQAGSVLYAQLTFGKGMVMVAPIQETAFGKLMVQPDEIGGVETQICYLHVDDPGAHQARAAAAGGDVVLDINTEASAGRGYSCRDPEGHIWNFGTYDPWDDETSQTAPQRPTRRLRALVVAVALALSGAAVYAHESTRVVASDVGFLVYGKIASAFETARASGHEDAGDIQQSAHALEEMRDQLAKERIARAAADQRAKDLRDELLQVRRASYGQDELKQARLALDITADKLAHALAEKAASERSAKEMREQLGLLRSSSDASEKAAKEPATKETPTKRAAKRPSAKVTSTRDKRRRAILERRARVAAKRAEAPLIVPFSTLPQADLY